MTKTDWGLLSDALLRIERLESDESGLLSFGLGNRGGIFVQEGRVGWAGVAPPDLSSERAVLRHSAECLVELCQSSLPMRWAAQPGQRHVAAFTFRPAEVWLEAVACCFPEHLESAQWELAALAGSGRQLVAFVLDDEQACLLPLTTLSTPSVAELRLLAHFASAMPRVSLELAQDPRFTLACTEDGHAAVVWWKDGVLFAELCQDRESLAVATVRHLACA